MPVGTRLPPAPAVSPLRLSSVPGGTTLLLPPPLPPGGVRWPGEHEEEGAGTIVGWSLEACRDTPVAVLVRAAPPATAATAAAAAAVAPWCPLTLLALLGRDRPIVCTEVAASAAVSFQEFAVQ